MKISLAGDIYYIPAIIVDVKAHTYPAGTIQTYVDFLGVTARNPVALGILLSGILLRNIMVIIAQPG